MAHQLAWTSKKESWTCTEKDLCKKTYCILQKCFSMSNPIKTYFYCDVLYSSLVHGTNFLFSWNQIDEMQSCNVVYPSPFNYCTPVRFIRKFDHLMRGFYDNIHNESSIYRVPVAVWVNVSPSIVRTTAKWGLWTSHLAQPYFTRTLSTMKRSYSFFPT